MSIGVEKNSKGGGGIGSVAFPAITGDPLGNTALQPYLSSVTNLENNEFKYLYWQAVSSNSGTVAIPTGATILLGEIEGFNALVETISSGKPTGNSPVTSGGSPIIVSSFGTGGNYILSGTPSAYPVAVLFVFKIKSKFISNVDLTKVIADEQIGIMIGASASNDGKSGEVPKPLAGEQNKILAGNGFWRTINDIITYCTDYRLENARHFKTYVNNYKTSFTGGNGVTPYKIRVSPPIDGTKLSGNCIILPVVVYSRASISGIELMSLSNSPTSEQLLFARNYIANGNFIQFSRLLYVNADKQSFRVADNAKNSLTGDYSVPAVEYPFNFNQTFYIHYSIIPSGGTHITESFRVEIRE